MENSFEKKAIFAKLQEILCELLITDTTVDNNYVLLGSGSMMDSLTAMQFIANIEEHFNINIIESDLDLTCCETIGSLVDYIFQHSPN